MSTATIIWPSNTPFAALQNGSYVPGDQTQLVQNLPGYTTLPYADLQNYDDMTPTLGSCFTDAAGLNINATVAGLVNSCLNEENLCCYDAAAADDQVCDPETCLNA